jgi:HEAT repeat protein
MAPPGCAPYIGTTYQSFIRQVRENPDPNIRYIAYAKLGSPGIYESKAQKDEAVKILIAKFEAGKEPVAVRAAIVRSLGNLGEKLAREVVLSAVNDKDNPVIRVEACRALGKVGLPEDATTLARIMMIDTLEDCRIAAIEAIGQLKAEDPRIYQILLDGMDNDDPAIRLECVNSLRTLTNKDYGTDPAAWRRELEPAIAAMSKSATPQPSVLPQAVVRSAPTLR